tara:strand:- start:37928 stop:40141 length:2214 start_codon:yes stop_codon:yes gene_type:complete
MYQQTLYKIIDPIPEIKKIKANSARKFKYGYNEEFDIICIGHDGQIGEIYEIQGLKIGLPISDKVYKRHNSKEKQYWEAFEYPQELARLNTMAHWEKQTVGFQTKYTPYIDEEVRRRDEGFWFKNNGVDTYITGSHYQYLQWSKIDVGAPDFRESNRLYWIFWEACRADSRCYGMCYLKNRRSGFSFMAASELINIATVSEKRRFGILSKTGGDAKKMFTGKVVPISINYPFFFKPVQDGKDRPVSELAYRVPANQFTRKRIGEKDELAGLTSLETTIDHETTGDNSYDGEKFKILVHDEFAKWLKPYSILRNWSVTKTCLRLGGRIVGKCMMGSTCNSKDKGGANGEKMYKNSNIKSRDENGETKSGLYSLFIPMEWNYEGFIDIYGYPVFDNPKTPLLGMDGTMIKIGVLQRWKNEAEGLKGDQDLLNEFYRQYPRTEEHAFRDEAKDSLFNLAKIYEQIDHNGDMKGSKLITRGSLSWENQIKDSRVVFTPNPNGRFLTSWIPPIRLQNLMIKKNGKKFPANEHLGAFGCDPYDISKAVGGGSNGSLHGLTKFSMEEVPPNMFFLEYISRPPTATMFFEDILMACVFYGMPLLAENNKSGLLYHFLKRGYRGYSMNPPNKVNSKLTYLEKEVGGIGASTDVIDIHAQAIETYIDKYVGLTESGWGDMYFNKTLGDWTGFNISNRTKHDASISSGLAIIACNRMSYHPKPERQVASLQVGIKKYSNDGMSSVMQR